MGDSSGVDLHRVKTGPLFVEKGEEEGVFFSRKTRRSSVSRGERVVFGANTVCFWCF